MEVGFLVMEIQVSTLLMIDHNTASNDGGGLLIHSNTTTTIQNSVFFENSASVGGGLCAYGSVNMFYSNLETNSALYGGGLALNAVTSSGKFNNMVITGNSASTGYGGGIYTYGAPNTSFINLLLYNNSALNGGGMANYGGSEPVIINATIAKNWATSSGDAIYNYQSSPYITNAILWENVHLYPEEEIIDFVNDGPYSQPSISNTILEQGCPSSATCTNVFSSDPLFIDAPNDNFHLQNTSPAIERGDNAALPEGITIDLDGNTRIIGASVDLGVYEAQYISSGILSTWIKMHLELSMMGARGLMLLLIYKLGLS